MQEESVMKVVASYWDDGEEVCLDGLNVAPTESTALVEFISYIKNFHKLKVTNCMMEHLAFREFTKLLTKENENCQLTELHLSKNKLTDEDAKSLSNALISDKCKLTKLDIGSNDLTDEGAKHLSDALMSDKCKLTELDITWNKLTHEGAKCLSDALMSDKCKLTKLDINGNNLTHEGAKYLSDALMSDKCKLTELNIGPVYTIPDSLVTTSSFAVTEQ
jgi:Ran GTPase-activating protein (RanGAP) involved in mRNA processing and transport